MKLIAVITHVSFTKNFIVYVTVETLVISKINPLNSARLDYNSTTIPINEKSCYIPDNIITIKIPRFDTEFQ